MNQLRRTRYSQ